MISKGRRPISFDAMVRFFIQSYNIPTKKDINRLVARIDSLEKLIRATSISKKRRMAPGKDTVKGRVLPDKSSKTASDVTLGAIKKFKDGAGFAEIQAKTGFEDKKLRNIIFRLYKIGKIARKSRGIYAAS